MTFLLVMFVPDGQDKRDHSERGKRETVAWGLGSPLPDFGDPNRPPPADRIAGVFFNQSVPTTCRSTALPFVKRQQLLDLAV
jgi:hypothetical protein